MDDTPRRVEDEFRSRSDERIAAGTDQSIRNYSATPGSAAADEDLAKRTTQIRGEIAQTRDEMSETIDAIQEKLRPGNIVATATDRVKQATTERVRSMAETASGTANDVMDYTREAAGTVAGEVRQNPIPIAMVGIGAAWLLMGRSKANDIRWRRRQHAAGARYGVSSLHAGRDRNEGMWGESNRTYGDDDRSIAAGGWAEGHGVVDRLVSNPIPTALATMGLAWLAFARGDGGYGGYDDDRWVDGEWRARYAGVKRRNVGLSGLAQPVMTDSVTSPLRDMATGAQVYAERAQEYAGEVTERAQEYAGEAMAVVQRRGRRAQNELQRMMDENPLLVGAAALAVGAALGMALPESERENEWMGDARDQIIDRAQDMARDAATHVQEVAGDMVGEVASRVVTGDKA